MDTTSKFNYYDILELNPHCTHQEITSAYEKLKLTYSGDNPAIYTIFSQDEAKEMLRLVEEAYTTLSNKSLRTQYDTQISRPVPTTVNQDSGQSSGSSTVTVLRPAGQVEVTKPQNVFSKPTYKEDSAFEIEIQNCKTWNGDMLKKVREYKNWKLDTLAERTKISAYYIQAIESMEHKGLPASVFVRGYVSQLCKVYGLDEKTVCDSYMREFKTRV